MKRIEVVFDIPLEKRFDYLPGEFEGKIFIGSRVRVPFGRQEKIGIVTSTDKEGEIDEGLCKNVLKVYDNFSLVTDDIFQVAKFLSSTYFSSLGQSLFSIVGRLPTKYKDDYNQELVREIKKTKTRLEKKCILLSNENERFEQNRLIAEEVNNGSVVSIFPEIYQAESYYEQVKAVFGEKTIIFHGDLKPKDRISRWFKMLSGEKMLVIGTRLGIFSPLSDIRTFIINNGYDSSYKEQQTPKYDACEVAEFRASQNNLYLFYLETSLSINRYYSIQNQSISFETKKEPNLKDKVYIVPITKKTVDKKISFLSKDVVSILEETILKEEKIAIIHNSKGNRKIFRCEKCETRLTCQKCDSELVLSEDGKTLLCRFCKIALPFENKCPECGSKRISFRLFGIERMFKVLTEEYPTVSISKIISQPDTDICKDCSILIGTKAIKKYLGEYSFGLVVFVSGESFLNVPDYRSEEYFFILVNEVVSLIQNPLCKIIIQTRNPNMEIYKSLKDFNPQLFLDKELIVRNQLGYPPYREIVKVEIRNKKKSLLDSKKVLIDNYLSENNIEIIYSGPSFPPVKKGKDVWKYLFRVNGILDKEELRRTIYEIGAYIETNPDRI